MSTSVRIVLGVLAAATAILTFIAAKATWAEQGIIFKGMAVLMAVFGLVLVEMSSGMLTIPVATTNQYIVEPPKGSTPDARRTMYVIVPGFMGSAKWLVRTFEKYDLHHNGWLVGVETDPKGSYDTYTMIEAIEAAVVSVEQQTGDDSMTIIVVAESQGANTAVEWIRFWNRTIHEMVINTGPDKASSTVFNTTLLKAIGSLYPGWLSRTGFWLWKKAQPAAAGPALTAEESAQNRADFMQISAFVAVGQVDELSRIQTFEGMLRHHVAHITYVTAKDYGHADPMVRTDAAITAWRKTVRQGRFAIKSIDEWPPGTHGALGLYEPYARFLATL